MSTSTREAVAPACASVAALLTVTARDDPPQTGLDAPTPCAHLDLRALVEHFVGTSTALAHLGLGRPLDADAPWGGGGQASDGDWRALLRQNLDDIGAGWSQEGAWEGEAQVGGSTMPRSTLGEMALIEVVVHGWDLARALGRPFEPDPAVGDAVERAVAGTAELGRRMGAYGPELAVPAEAPALERALGQAGRDPGWTA